MTRVARGGGNRPGEDGPYRPPNPADAPPYPPKKLAKKNKGKKGDPENEYSKPLPGAPPGHNVATNLYDGSFKKINNPNA